MPPESSDPHPCSVVVPAFDIEHCYTQVQEHHNRFRNFCMLSYRSNSHATMTAGPCCLLECPPPTPPIGCMHCHPSPMLFSHPPRLSQQGVCTASSAPLSVSDSSSTFCLYISLSNHLSLFTHMVTKHATDACKRSDKQNRYTIV